MARGINTKHYQKVVKQKKNRKNTVNKIIKKLNRLAIKRGKNQVIKKKPATTKNKKQKNTNDQYQKTFPDLARPQIINQESTNKTLTTISTPESKQLITNSLRSLDKQQDTTMPQATDVAVGQSEMRHDNLDTLTFTDVDSSSKTILTNSSQVLGMNNEHLGALRTSGDSPLIISTLEENYDQKQVANSWKNYLRLGIVLGLIVLMAVDFFIAFFNLQNQKIISPIAGSSFSVVPKRPVLENSKEVIGFLPSWQVAKKTIVDTRHLSQLIYFGLAVNDRGEIVKFTTEGKPVVEWSYFTSEYLQSLIWEAKHHQVKVLVAVTNFDNETIDKLVSSKGASSKLTSELISLIEKYNLDGININFEYITNSDFPTAIYLNHFLANFVSTIKKEHPSIIISFDVNATAVMIDSAYDMVKIGELVDQVILMGYDYSRADSSRAGPVAPLRAAKDGHSISQSIKSLVGRVPNNKLILGIPFYGYEWQTLSTSYGSQTIPNTGAIATYSRVRDLLENRPEIKVQWAPDAESPWFWYWQSGAIKQVFYEDERSLAKKLDFIDDQQLSGIAIWALGYEGKSTNLWRVISRWRVR